MEIWSMPTNTSLHSVSQLVDHKVETHLLPILCITRTQRQIHAQKLLSSSVPKTS